MKVLVLGLGKSGRSCAQYLMKQGYEVTAVDRSLQQQEILLWLKDKDRKLLTVLEESEEIFLDEYSFVVASPGISRRHPLYQRAILQHIPIFSEAELAMRVMKEKCIGITGSNGKTTLTLFLTHLLQLSGIKAKAIGNVGIPFTEYLLQEEKADVCVCELSSYQLETLKAQVLDIAIVLDITPDHLDRYDCFTDYALTKLQIFQCLKKKGVGFVTDNTYELFKKEINECKNLIKKIPFEFNNQNKNCYLQLTKNKEYCDFLRGIKEKALGLEVLYLGKAVADYFGIKKEVLDQAIATFKKPEHRLEYVATINGVAFINDSKATNVESVMYAVNMFHGQMILIVGGKDKNLCFTQWVKAFESKVDRVFAIGECAEKIQTSLEGSYEVKICKDLKEAVWQAFNLAKPHMHILLSPGCASFDSYRDYRHRGESFKEIVMALKERSLG